MSGQRSLFRFLTCKVRPSYLSLTPTYVTEVRQEKLPSVNNTGLQLCYRSVSNYSDKMKLILYGIPVSPPSRAVLLTGKALALNLKFKEIDMFEKEEHKQDWFLKLNPNHTVPTLDDDGFCLWESRAIMGYLVNKYGKDDRLYPREATARALVDNMLYFDIGALYQNICDYLFAPTFEGAEKNPKKGEALKEKLTILNQLLESRPYAAGDHLTIADFSILQSIATLDAYSYKMRPYPAVQKWYKKLHSELPYYDECMKGGVEELRKMVKPVPE